MATNNPLVVRWATKDDDERDLLTIDLRDRSVVPHDNVVDFVLHAVRAGAATAQYLISAASRPTSGYAAARMGAIMNWLWGTEPTAAGLAESLKWLDHAIITLSAFSPGFDQLANGATVRMGSVAFLAHLDESFESRPLAAGHLALIGRRIANWAQYNAVRDARRAQVPWFEIEELNNFETIAGARALVSLSGGRVDLLQVERTIESPEALWELLEGRIDDSLDQVSTPPYGEYRAFDRSHRDAIRVPRPTGGELIAEFLTERELRERDRRGQTLVWFGTDRVRVYSDGILTGFGNEASSPRGVSYGRCLVTVPEAHRFGEVRVPWWKRVVRRSSDGTLRLRAVEGFEDADAFAHDLNTTLADSIGDERDALIYVHGYNTSFEAAAIRAAQMGFDLNVGGITGFYSWPSAARAQKYTRDADNIAASEPPFTEFLDTLTRKTDITRLNLIVHSMGNRLVAEALQTVAPSLRARGIKLNALVLAAPDINVDRFRQLAVVYPTVAACTTMYVSERDLALGASHIVWDSPRAGLTPPITVVEGVDTIEVTDIDISRLGHGYYAAAHPVLYDIREVLRGVFDPRVRVRLSELHSAPGVHWKLTP